MQKIRSRPEPVSCQSCRSKKLKCNRARPCSNCSARGITCAYTGASASHVQSIASHEDTAALQERVERLEAMLMTPQSDTREHVNSAVPTPASLPSTDTQSRVREYDALEDVGTREDTVLPILSGGIEFRVSSIQDILGAQNLQPIGGHLQHGVIELPEFAVANELLQSYETNVDHVYRILHIPTVRAFMKTLYLRHDQGKSINSGQAALLLSIFAFASMFLSSSISPATQLLKTEASRSTKAFSKAALDVLDHTRRNTSCTIEDLQAHLLMSMLTFQLDGFSARGRILFSTAVAIARDLRLHQLDSVSGSSVRDARNVRTLIDLEVKRRVFWYIASTDWLLSAVSGPQAGTYSLQPKHIQVYLPRDCTDDELPLLDEHLSNGEAQPTGITYLLERVKLAHLCREMVDLTPLNAADISTVHYDQVIVFDKRILQFVAELPYFFKTDLESRARTKALEVLLPALPLLRYSINQAVHSRRCRLHQRYLFRQSEDPRYYYSRQACVESARAVIQSDLDLVCPDPPWEASARRGIATHFKHLATVVLIMDLCFNPDHPDTEEVKFDVRNMLARFEAAKSVSPLLDRFLRSLHNILQKHGIDLAGSNGVDIGQSQILIHLPPGFDYFHSPDTNEAFSGNDDDHLLASSSIEELWPFMSEEQHIDISAWEDFLASLDSQPL